MNSTVECSIVMSVYNDCTHLEDAINSILNQSFSNFEFIIVDDGSTDPSVSIIRDFNDSRIKLFIQEHKGLPSALNYGILNSTSDLIVRMDADDVSLLDRIEKQVAFMEKNPEIALIGGSATLIDSNSKAIGKRIVPDNEEVILGILPYACPTIHPTLCFMKFLFDRLGGYREIFTYSQDYDLILRIVDSGYRITNIPDILLEYRTNKKHKAEKIYKHTKLVLLAQRLHNQRRKSLCEKKELLQPFDNIISLSWIRRIIFNAYYQTLLLSSLNASPRYLWRMLNIIICLLDIDLFKVMYNDYMFHKVLKKYNGH